MKTRVGHHEDPSANYTNAHKVAKEWYPDVYTEIVGQDPAKHGLTDFQPLTAADSSILEKREFLASRSETHVRTQSAMRDLAS